MNDDGFLDLGSGVRIKTKGKEEKTQRSVDIEDLKEQGYTTEIEREMIREHRQRAKNDRYEFAEDMTVKPPTNPHRRFDAVRDIDVDGLGKKKTGFFDVNGYKK